MQREAIELLVAFDQNYIGPFRTLLCSLLRNNPGERFRIFLLHSAIPERELAALGEYCGRGGAELIPLRVDRAIFEGAPVSRQYPQEMYYRLLAPRLLPESVARVLYLDPDILALNPLRPLWERELGEYTFAAASHSGLFDVGNHLNRLRLSTDHDYYNSGVLLLDLGRARTLVKPEEVFTYVREHSGELLLPDQDVFNALYGSKTLPLPDEIWNYDPKYYAAYRLRSEGMCDLDWVMGHTVFLHFCGKHKPWLKSSRDRFSALYKHYMRLASR